MTSFLNQLGWVLLGIVPICLVITAAFDLLRAMRRMSAIKTYTVACGALWAIAGAPMLVLYWQSTLPWQSTPITLQATTFNDSGLADAVLIVPPAGDVTDQQIRGHAKTTEIRSEFTNRVKAYLLPIVASPHTSWIPGFVAGWRTERERRRLPDGDVATNDDVGGL